jgi:hypothetical protein
MCVRAHLFNRNAELISCADGIGDGCRADADIAPLHRNSAGRRFLELVELHFLLLGDRLDKSRRWSLVALAGQFSVKAWRTAQKASTMTPVREMLLNSAMRQIEDLPGLMPSVLAEIRGVIERALEDQLLAIVEDLDAKALELDEDRLA